MPWSMLRAVVGIAVAAGLACFETAAVVKSQLPLNPALCFLSAPVSYTHLTLPTKLEV